MIPTYGYVVNNFVQCPTSSLRADQKKGVNLIIYTPEN